MAFTLMTSAALFDGHVAQILAGDRVVPVVNVLSLGVNKTGLEGQVNKTVPPVSC